MMFSRHLRVASSSRSELQGMGLGIQSHCYDCPRVTLMCLPDRRLYTTRRCNAPAEERREIDKHLTAHRVFTHRVQKNRLTDRQTA